MPSISDDDEFLQLLEDDFAFEPQQYVVPARIDRHPREPAREMIIEQIDLTSSPIAAPARIARSETIIGAEMGPATTQVPDEESDEDRALATVLELFPDISHDHVRELIKNYFGQAADGGTIKERVVDDVIASEGKYPKQKDALREKQAKNEALQAEQRLWDSKGHIKPLSPGQREFIIKALSRAYPSIPKTWVSTVLCRRGDDIFAAYLDIASDESNYHECPPMYYKHLKKPRSEPKTSRDWSPVDDGKLQGMIQALADAEAQAQRELDGPIVFENPLDQTADGPECECGCCFSDVPIDKMVECASGSGHFFCVVCFENFAKSKIGEMKSHLTCFSTDGCTSTFTRSEVKRVLAPKLFEKLEQLEQMDAIKGAQLEGLEECPFCEFKIICPPVEIDREFRCQNEDCQVTSCRLCKLTTHIPKTCEEAKRERGDDARHKVEEAMTAALIRTCPKPQCKTPIIKSDGCNKMTCGRCNTMMCYVCRADITQIGYQHFRGDAGNRKGCVLHDIGSDTIERRDEDNIRKAEENAIAELMQEHGELEKQVLSVSTGMKAEVKKRKRSWDEARRQLQENPRGIMRIRDRVHRLREPPPQPLLMHREGEHLAEPDMPPAPNMPANLPLYQPGNPYGIPDHPGLYFRNTPEALATAIRHNQQLLERVLQPPQPIHPGVPAAPNQAAHNPAQQREKDKKAEHQHPGRTEPVAMRGGLREQNDIAFRTIDQRHAAMQAQVATLARQPRDQAPLPIEAFLDAPFPLPNPPGMVRLGAVPRQPDIADPLMGYYDFAPYNQYNMFDETIGAFDFRRPDR